MPEITRRLEIDMGHRLMNHESKCRNAHGHRYAFEITVAPNLGGELDKVGRVIDFGVIRDEVGGWINDTWDHGFMVEFGDPMLNWLREHDQKTVVLDCPPSIENLVRLVFENATRILAHHGIEVTRVRGYETPTSWADYTLSEHKVTR